ncbi:hypothetical protein T09_15154 [Trichinella sp. T9]|nr:hypothetical protein T09_15154 [Trichinella sp. T9]
METMHVDQESQNGDQSRHEAQNCPKTDPKRDKVVIFRAHEQTTTRISAMRNVAHLSVRAGHRHERCPALARTSEPRRGASAGWSYGRRAETGAGVVVAAAALLLFSLVRIHAQLIRLAKDRQLVAVQIRGPFETVLAHQWRAAGPGPFAYRPAGRQRFRIIRYANRRVHAAEEKTQIRTAVDFDQRPELVHFHAGFFLGLVVELVGHLGHIVADRLAHRDADLLTSSVLGLLTNIGERFAERDHRNCVIKLQ